ncbi:transferase spermidine synthase [Undibacterium sp. SXout11W]|uniref:spermine/spermidine synthase domain-containing protein n=1 Tax=Undibacterium sp. SXout11W TaxID=3413050 RepID=UPI003BF084B2
MAKARQSLSRLFLNKPSTEELQHQATLKGLAEAAAGKPFILNDEPLRIMYLTPTCMQSVMRIDQPHQLLCAYSRAMMGFLLFNPKPQHIVLIGLGGGSLVKYCYQHLPDCRITAVEINADVIAMRRQFMIPDDDERLRIIHADAVEWLPRQRCDADVIFLDAYDIHGLVPSLNSAQFYANCYRQLNHSGVLVANVWGKPSVLTPMLTMLHQQFSNNVWWIKSADSYNLLVYAVKHMSRDFEQLHAIEKDSALHLNHPTLDLQWLTNNLQSIQDQRFKPTSENSKNLLQEELIKRLRTVLVHDGNVPQSYTEFKSLILNLDAASRLV